MSASVGVVMFWPLLREHVWAVSAGLVLSVAVTAFVTAWELKRLAEPRADVGCASRRLQRYSPRRR